MANISKPETLAFPSVYLQFYIQKFFSDFVFLLHQASLKSISKWNQKNTICGGLYF